MAVYFHQTSQFSEIRARIEEHLYSSVLQQEQDVEAALRSVGRFAEAMDRLFDTLEQMYQSPGPKDAGSEGSFPVHNGRYRVFFKVMVKSGTDFDITLLDIDDNRQSNLDRFPFHRIISFDAED
jgi:hypothetical protein